MNRDRNISAPEDLVSWMLSAGQDSGLPQAVCERFGLDLAADLQREFTENTISVGFNVADAEHLGRALVKGLEEGGAKVFVTVFWNHLHSIAAPTGASGYRAPVVKRFREPGEPRGLLVFFQSVLFTSAVAFHCILDLVDRSPATHVIVIAVLAQGDTINELREDLRHAGIECMVWSTFSSVKEPRDLGTRFRQAQSRLSHFVESRRTLVSSQNSGSDAFDPGDEAPLHEIVARLRNLIRTYAYRLADKPLTNARIAADFGAAAVHSSPENAEFAKAVASKALRELERLLQPSDLDQLVRLLRSGRDTWNTFREQRQFSPEDLSGIDLSGSHLSGFNLDWCSFRSTVLDNSDLSACSLLHADFRSSQLRSVDFSDATLSHATFEYALCEGASFALSHGDSPTFLGTDLREALFAGARYREPDFREADLAAASMRHGRFLGARFQGCRIRNTDFSGSDLRMTHGISKETILQSGGLVDEWTMFNRGSEIGVRNDDFL